MTLKEDDVPGFEKMVADHGYYPIIMPEDEFQALSQDPEAVDRLFKETILKVAERWANYADERLGEWGIRCFVCPGNDDMFGNRRCLSSRPSMSRLAEAECRRTSARMDHGQHRVVESHPLEHSPGV